MAQTADPVRDISVILEGDLWRFIADAPPDPWLVSDATQHAAQLQITTIVTKRDGCSLQHAHALIVGVDELGLRIDQLGGEARIGGSVLWRIYNDALDLSAALLDMLCDGRLT